MGAVVKSAKEFRREWAHKENMKPEQKEKHAAYEREYHAKRWATDSGLPGAI